MVAVVAVVREHRQLFEDGRYFLSARRGEQIFFCTRIVAATDRAEQRRGIGAQRIGFLGACPSCTPVVCLRELRLARDLGVELGKQRAAIVELASASRRIDQRDRLGILARAHERAREAHEVARGTPSWRDRDQRFGRDVPREMSRGFACEQAQRRVVAIADEVIRRLAHGGATAQPVVEPVVEQIGQLEQRLALFDAARQRSASAKMLRGRFVITELDRELRELLHELDITRRDVIRGLERGERIADPARGPRAASTIAQRERAGLRFAEPTAGRALFAGLDQRGWCGRFGIAPIGEELQRRLVRRIDLERALMRGERNIGATELELQIREPRQQRCLAMRMARGGRDLAAEDHGHALEVTAITPLRFEGVESRQMSIGEPQRHLEAANCIIGALGTPE